MNLNGTFVFNGPRATVYELLQDPAVLVKALPGAKTLTRTGEDRYEGTMKVSIGPVTATEFAMSVTLSDKVPPTSFHLQIEGKGAAGFTRGTAAIALADAPDHAGTLMTYSSDVHVGGRIASVGQRLVESVGKMMMKQALEALNKALAARLQGTA
jgi:carbon monoxide dehydrogenase subunit G